ncbi:hypothetical protein NDU88_011722 [Pleurodeles waltl]|uniref:Secreted protein n=1 Tax=Pleurodeles waltl TaxID=8319 RepID=A0AAV7R1V6_PLEWA|nr:hypothetical protein NDU88_011722 [Pleurodeles waltl]
MALLRRTRSAWSPLLTWACLRGGPGSSTAIHEPETPGEQTVSKRPGPPARLKIGWGRMEQEYDDGHVE